MMPVTSWRTVAAKSACTAFTVGVFVAPMVGKMIDPAGVYPNPNVAATYITATGTSGGSSGGGTSQVVYLGKPPIDVAKFMAAAEADHAQREVPFQRT